MPAMPARRGHEVLLICATDEHGTPAELAAAAAGEPVADVLRPALGGAERARAAASGSRFDHYGRSSSPQNHRLTQHFAGRLADAGLIAEVSEKQVYSRADGRFLPDRYIVGTCPNCGYDAGPRRPVRELHQAARPDRPHQPALGDLRLDRPRGARDQAPLPAPEPDAGEAERLDRRQDRLAGAHHLDRPEVARRRRGAAGPRDHPRPRLGHPGPARRRALAGHGGQGLLRLVRRADRVHRRHRRMGRRQPARPAAGSAGGARTRARRTCATSSSWARTTCPSTRFRFPATILGTRAEPWKLVDYIKSFNYLNYEGGKFSTSEGRGVFMDQALEILPADYWRWWLMSNVPEGSDSELHLGELPGRSEQGPRRRAGQLRQPRHQVRPRPLRRRPARGRRLGAGGGRGGGGHRPPGRRLRGAYGGDRAPQGGAGAARHLGGRQRVPAGGRALDGDQDRPGPRRGRDPVRGQPDPALRGAEPAVPARTPPSAWRRP